MDRRTFLAAPATLFGAQSAVRVVALPTEEFVFPPEGRAYRENGAAHRIWRSTLEAAPDLVIVHGSSAAGFANALEKRGIPSRVVDSESAAEASRVAAGRVPQSPASRDMVRRLSRSPREMATQLSGKYGSALQNVVYIEAFAVLGHLRLGRRGHVAALLEPYLSGQKDSLGKATASHYSGHLLVAEYARRNRDKRAADLAVKAAQRAIEQPLDNEMSDSVFMVCPILAAAATLSPETASFAKAAAAHYDRMEKLCRRPDGIWRHSPLSDAAWGRGNAFPLLGLALTLSYLPKSDPAFERLLSAYLSLADRLATHQDDAGLWHQVIDRSDSYAEFSATSMIAMALERGMRRGWLPRGKYSAVVARAWRAVQRRTSVEGELMDVCESTGKQPSLEAYFNREAIFGPDPRGGAMAFMLSTELAGLE
jgi:rhamnogalacturonyl hydrolase YesR